MKDRGKKFFEDLAGLCKKYKVTITASDDNKPYGLHSPEILFDFEYMEEDYGKFDSEQTLVYFDSSGLG